MREIKFTYENKEYRLGFSRQSVKQLEAQGFDLEKIGEKPATMLPLLFYGAFAMNHRGIKRKIVDEIWETIVNKDDFIPAMVELYADTINDLLSDKEDDNAKKTMWEMSE